MSEHNQQFDTFTQWVNRESSWLTRHLNYGEKLVWKPTEKMKIDKSKVTMEFVEKHSFRLTDENQANLRKD